MKIKLFIIVILSLLTFACSTTKEISVKTEETTTIQPITLQAPPIRGEIPNIPLTKPDTTEPYGEYEGEKVITTKDIVTGKLTEAFAKVKVTIKKDLKGKPTANVTLDIKQSPVSIDAKVTKSKTVTDTKTETTGFGVYFKWFVIAILIMAGVVALLWFTKLLPKRVCNR